MRSALSPFLLPLTAPFSHPRSRGYGAFTLIQLMVVIGVIGVLMGLLFPALRNGIEMSRETRCGAQLRQIHLAMTSFAQDHQGRFPAYLKTATGKAHQYWPARLRPYFALPVTGQWADNDPPEVFRCPSDTRATGFYPNTSVYGSYGLCGLNGLVWGVYAYPNGEKRSAWQDGFPTFSVKYPSRTAMIFEHDLVYTSGPEQLRASTHAFRHGKRINVAYFDGHIGQITKDGIPDAMDIFWRVDADPNASVAP